MGRSSQAKSRAAVLFSPPLCDGTTTSHKPEKATREELGDSLKEIPWKSFFQSPAVWAMIYTHFCGIWGHYTCLSWLPTYFSEALSLNLRDATWVRKICQTIAFLAPAICMTLLSVDIGLPPWEIAGTLTAGLALSSFALSGLYCTHQDISPEYASILLRKKENHLFKWVDESLLDEIRRVEAQKLGITQEIEDLKKSLKMTVEEEVKKQKKSFEVGCLGSILWLLGNFRSQE